MQLDKESIELYGEPIYPSSIGNGYVGYTIGSPFMYLTNVYTVSNNIPRRARIPNTQNIIIQNACYYYGRLDPEKGIYIKKCWTKNGSYYVDIKEKLIAHRIHKNLLAHTFHISNPGDAVTLHLQSKYDIWSGDVALIHKEHDEHVTLGYEIVNPELLRNKDIVVVSDARTSLTIPANTSMVYTYFTVIDICTEGCDYQGNSIWEQLYSDHVAAWNSMMPRITTHIYSLQNKINTCYYYLLSSIRHDYVASISPGGIASDLYNGHIFWDAEIWMFPALLVFYPDLARIMLLYRLNHIDKARSIARSNGYEGVQYPWESSSAGTEVTPSWANTRHEHHITGDIVLAIELYWDLTKDRLFLDSYSDIVIEAGLFWLSRSEYADGFYHINGVIPPDEHAGIVDDSIYTNYLAIRNILFAMRVADILDIDTSILPMAEWSDMITNIVLPEAYGIHLEHQGYTGQLIKQADVVLLGYPLMMNMSREDRAADLNFYQGRVKQDTPAMTHSMQLIGWAELFPRDSFFLYSEYSKSYDNYRYPFGVWSETPTSYRDEENFLTAAGGFLQGIIYGFLGLRILPDHLYMKPILPPETSYMEFWGICYKGYTFDIEYNDSKTKIYSDHGYAVKQYGETYTIDGHVVLDSNGFTIE